MNEIYEKRENIESHLLWASEGSNLLNINDISNNSLFVYLIQMIEMKMNLLLNFLVYQSLAHWTFNKKCILMQLIVSVNVNEA